MVITGMDVPKKRKEQKPKDQMEWIREANVWDRFGQKEKVKTRRARGGLKGKNRLRRALWWQRLGYELLKGDAFGLLKGVEREQKIDIAVGRPMVAKEIGRKFWGLAPVMGWLAWLGPLPREHRKEVATKANLPYVEGLGSFREVREYLDQAMSPQLKQYLGQRFELWMARLKRELERALVASGYEKNKAEENANYFAGELRDELQRLKVGKESSVLLARHAPWFVVRRTVNGFKLIQIKP